MKIKRLRILQNMAIFGGINGDALEFLLDRATERNLEAGACFFREGDSAESMFVLEQGHAEVIKEWQGQHHVLRELQPGDCFGEVALLDMMPRSASVQAGAACRAIEIPRSALYDLYQTHPDQFTLIVMNMAREVSRRLRDADMRLFQVQREQPELQVAAGYDLT